MSDLLGGCFLPECTQFECPCFLREQLQPWRSEFVQWWGREGLTQADFLGKADMVAGAEFGQTDLSVAANKGKRAQTLAFVERSIASTSTVQLAAGLCDWGGYWCEGQMFWDAGVKDPTRVVDTSLWITL